MPMLDIFQNDAFSVTSLTAAMQDQAYVPGRLGQLGVFNSEGVSTTTFAVEMEGQTLGLVPAGERGASGTVYNADKRKMLPISTIHLPQRATILADEIQGVRAFGSETEVQAIQSVVNKRLARMRRDLDATIEYQRVGAVKGSVVDADGSTVLLDVFNAFNVSQTTIAMALTTGTTKVKLKCLDILDAIESALDGISFSEVRVLCGKEFWKSFITHSAITDAYDRWMDGQYLRQNPLAAFEFGDIQWERYRGQVGGTSFIADDDAYVVVGGVPDLYITRFAPADYLETVNTNGLPYYAKQEPLPFNKGIDMEGQSNAISLCTRPKAAIKLARVS